MIKQRGFTEPRYVSFQLNSPVLYRYCDPLGVDVLRSLRLKVTPPAEFNDPFEFLPKIELTTSREDISKRLTEHNLIREMWHEYGKPESFRAFKLRYKEGFAQKGTRHVAKALKDIEHFAHKWRDNLADGMGKSFGLVCYSEVPDDLLMWGHYTRSHQGFVLGFDVKHHFFRKKIPPIPVIYRSERVDFAFGPDGIEYREPSLALVRSKSIHWSYEKEWRQMVSLSSCVSVLTENGRTRFFHNVPPKALTSVILGIRTPNELVHEIVEAALRRPELRHVKLRRAVLHERDFTISVV